MKQRLLASAAMILVGSGIYAASTYYVPAPANETTVEQFSASPLFLSALEEMKPPDPRDSLPEAEEESGGNQIHPPSPEVLGFVQSFSEGADTSDPTQSYGGRIFQKLLEKDGAWINSIYSYASQTPQQLADRLGLPRERILGAYDPENETHQRDAPDSWVIPHFHDIRVNIRDGDGHPVSMYFNGKAIMSLANVYAFFQDSDDPELWEDYCMKLWDRSHSLSVSMSEVYYCDSCVENWAEEGELTEITGFVDNWISAENAEEGEKKPEDDGTLENEAFVDNSDSEEIHSKSEDLEEENVSSETTGIVDNQNLQAEDPSVETTGFVDYLPSESSGPGTDPEDNTYPQPAETASASNASLAESRHIPEYTEDAAAADNKRSQCPGHIDLVVNMKVLGLDEEKGLFEADLIGNKKENFREGGWQGWIPSAREPAKLLAGQDWFQEYGLSMADESISLCTPLPESEIHNYMKKLPPELSENRKAFVRFALESVGRVPYYWGGKANAPGYEGNHFGTLVTADNKGRVLKGLDCSGWVSWVYWSVTGQHLPHESTDGLTACGTRISREELQPGDILIRTGSDAHAVMFLEWAGDNQIRCVHESSAGTNNVTIAIRDADWPWYIRLME